LLPSPGCVTLQSGISGNEVRSADTGEATSESTSEGSCTLACKAEGLHFCGRTPRSMSRTISVKLPGVDQQHVDTPSHASTSVRSITSSSCNEESSDEASHRRTPVDESPGSIAEETASPVDWLDAGTQRPVVLSMDFDEHAAPTPKSCCPDDASTPWGSPRDRTTSDAAFYDPDQTIILFDWDDTLCPSSACIECYGLTDAEPLPEGDLASRLNSVALEAKALLHRASELAAQVVIVTNAGDGWVDSSCTAWMPELRPALTEIQVVSARAKWEPCGVSSPTGWKTREFQNVIDRFYSRYENQSWKNIVAVGDAPYEHEALQRVLEENPEGCAENCRSKSVRFMPKPTIDELVLQIRALREALGTIVRNDGDLDLQIPMEVVDLE